MRSQLRVRDDERRPEEDRVAVDPVRVARARVDAARPRRAPRGRRARSGDRRAGTAPASRDRRPAPRPTISPRPRISPRLGCGAETLVEQVGQSFALVALASTRPSVSRMRSTSRATAAPPGVVRVREPVDEAAAGHDRVVDARRRGHEPERPVAGRCRPWRATRMSAWTPQWSSPNHRPVRPNPSSPRRRRAARRGGGRPRRSAASSRRAGRRRPASRRRSARRRTRRRCPGPRP